MPEAKYRLFCRVNGIYYRQDNATGQQISLSTRNRKAALEKLRAANEAVAQPRLNLEMARIYLKAHDVDMTRRTWREVMTAYSERGRESSRERCRRAFAGRDFDPIRDLALIDTRAEDLLRVLSTDKSSVNHYLRRLVNYAEGLGWLPWTIIAKKAWPKVRRGKRRALTAEEHERILTAEGNLERHRYYRMLWLTGGSQSDIARLTREQFDRYVLTYHRGKLPEDAGMCKLRVGFKMEALLAELPSHGPLFPNIANQKSKDRAAEFWRRCNLLTIKGVSLHSYRYQWAERAAEAGYPMRFAQEALGHKSAAVHRAYSRRAVVEVPALEDYEQGKVVPFPKPPSQDHLENGAA